MNKFTEVDFKPTRKVGAFHLLAKIATHISSGLTGFLWPVILEKRYFPRSLEKILGRILNDPLRVVFSSLNQSMWTKE